LRSQLCSQSEGSNATPRAAPIARTVVPGSLAMVVSQDGGVRFVTTHRDHVTWWEHGPGDF